VLQAFANTLPRRLLETTVLPLVATALQCGSVPMQLACLELGLLSRLQAAASLAAFLRTVLPAVLSAVVCDEVLEDDNGTTPSAAPQVHSTLSSTAWVPLHFAARFATTCASHGHVFTACTAETAMQSRRPVLHPGGRSPVQCREELAGARDPGARGLAAAAVPGTRA